MVSPFYDKITCSVALTYCNFSYCTLLCQIFTVHEIEFRTEASRKCASVERCDFGAVTEHVSACDKMTGSELHFQRNKVHNQQTNVKVSKAVTTAEKSGHTVCGAPYGVHGSRWNDAIEQAKSSFTDMQLIETKS